jgi:hypothetical protein
VGSRPWPPSQNNRKYDYFAGANSPITWNDFYLGDVDNDPAHYAWVGSIGSAAVQVNVDYIVTYPVLTQLYLSGRIPHDTSAALANRAHVVVRGLKPHSVRYKTWNPPPVSPLYCW